MLNFLFQRQDQPGITRITLDLSDSHLSELHDVLMTRLVESNDLPPAIEYLTNQLSYCRENPDVTVLGGVFPE